MRTRLRRISSYSLCSISLSLLVTICSLRLLVCHNRTMQESFAQWKIFCTPIPLLFQASTPCTALSKRLFALPAIFRYTGASLVSLSPRSCVMINVTPRVGLKNRRDWAIGLPNRPAPLDLTPQEQTFLARYSEHGDRLQALTEAGLLARPTFTGDAPLDALAGAILEQDPPRLGDYEQQAHAQANAILAKIALLPMADVASALGGDRVRYPAGLWRAFQADGNREVGDWKTAATGRR